MGDSPDKTFMIVDENANNSLFWEVALKEAYPTAQTQVCKTGYEALDVAKKGRFDFFIASWELSPMSGLIFMQKLRQIYKFKHTPFLIFSSLLNEEDLSLAQEFNIKNYLLRPFDKERVLDKVKTMLEEENSMDSLQRNLRKVEDWIADNKINEALKLINDCLKPGPHATRAFTLNGDIWSRTEHVDKAERSYKEALKFDAENVGALNGLAKLYFKMKRYTEASELFEALNKKCPQNLERLVNLGNVYLGTGEDGKAEELFKQVKEMDSENPDAAEGLGKVQFARNNLELAAKFFKESGKGEELAAYFNNMGIAMVNQGKHDEAINLYKNAISVIPDRERVHLLEFNVGLAYKKSERFGDAAEAFARSVLLNPAYEKAYQGMVLTLREAQARKQNVNPAVIQQAAEKFKQAQAAAKEEAKEGSGAS